MLAFVCGAFVCGVISGNNRVVNVKLDVVDGVIALLYFLLSGIDEAFLQFLGS